MSFKWLNKQGVESTGGFVLQRMHRFYYHYMEGNRVMVIHVEPGIKYEEISLDDSTKWQPPYEVDELPHEKLIEIRQNISSALNFMDIPYAFNELQ